ncbi:MAG: valine--tRNA ligase [Clostridia bacterium]|nr:valine--tRNA ligase [Clostridia bacterium]
MEKIYTPENFEHKIYENWLEKGYFASKPDGRKSYTIVMPPCNVTGKAHIGHALDDTIQDILIRAKRMQGFNALWVPGTDHAAIATEQVLVKHLKSEGLSKEGVGREEFLKRGWDWYRQYTHVICDQLKKLGVSCDWDRLAFTMDENLNHAVRHVFCEYYKQGLIYKGKRVVNYCPSCKTTISDNENVYVEQNTYLWYIRYPFADGSGEVVVATTRPETLFGDTAVAVNPNDERFKGQIGKDLILPLMNKKIKLIGDDYCEIGFGTGAVKITPAHDPNDYEVGLRHNLEVVNCIDNDGKLTAITGQFVGMDRIEARSAIEKALQEGGYLVKKEKYKNQAGTCERCGTFTEPKISTQWFVKMEELAKPAVEAVKSGKLKFHPKRYEKTYLNWLENIQDWCISRQIWLGHRIPVFTCENGHVFACEDDPKDCPHCHSSALTQDNDVLDTWFSSALWPFSTLGYPQQTEDLKYYYPTSTLVTGYDIITFWVSKMVFSGLKFMGDVPFRDVVIHGIVRDIKGVKMSKHLGNGIDPMDMVNKYGADALRLSLINGMSMGTDVKYDEDKARDAKVFINKLYNASKFVLQNLEGMEQKDLSKIKLQEKDKWILSELDALIKSVNKNIEKYTLGVATSNLVEFTVSKFCDWYIELSKVDLYGEDKNRKNDCQNVLFYVFDKLLKLFHPFIPFVTEHIYQELPCHEETIMLTKFPDKVKIKLGENGFDRVIEIIKAIRNARAEFNVPDNKRTSLKFKFDSVDELVKANLKEIAKMAFGNEACVVNEEPEEKSVKVICGDVKVYIPMGELVDSAKEKERLEKEIKSVEFEIERSNKMLSNPGFANKAPQAMVENEKTKLETNKLKLEKLKAELSNI